MSDNFKPATFERFITCPTTAQGAMLHPLFKAYGGKLWHNNVCYVLKAQEFSRRITQQFCCYDVSSSKLGVLVTQGYGAGFAYNERKLTEIISNGLKCCSDIENCEMFYNLYPRTRQVPALFPFGKYFATIHHFLWYSLHILHNYFIAWGGGDPRLTTYDNLTYAFNGLGKYVLSRATDKSFEIQARTKILQNVGKPNIAGTLFDSFAIKTSDSQTFELRMTDSINPKIGKKFCKIKTFYTKCN